MKTKILLLAFAILLATAGDIFAQGSLFGGSGERGDRDKSKPTEITSDTMDIQSAQNMAVFTGNVIVKDQELTITCDKMTIFLEDKAKSDDAPPENGQGSKGGKKISRILCEGNVVITRKYKDDDKDKEQQGKAGQAEYDLKEQKITLSDNPVLNQDNDQVAGDQIIMYRESERVIIKGRGKLNISPDTLQSPEPESGK